MKYSVMVVDDDEGIRESLGMKLDFMGYDVFKAASGNEAIQLAEKSSIDLVILDIKMPGLDGIQTALQLLRRQNVIFHTGYDLNQADVEAAYNLALEVPDYYDFVPKNSGVKELEFRIKKNLKSIEKRNLIFGYVSNEHQERMRNSEIETLREIAERQYGPK